MRARIEVARVLMQPLGYRVGDAGTMLGVSRSTVFGMIKDGRLEAKKIGAATVVTHESIVRLFDCATWTEATRARKNGA